jgi:hypothetical protein
MAKTIPLTNFDKYVTVAKAIRGDLGKSTASPLAVRRAVEDLADLAVKALEEAQQSIEGLAALMMALHPEVTRTR